MLGEQAIITRQEEYILLSALDGLDQEAVVQARYDGTCEDLFFYIQDLLAEAVGSDTG
jgi:argininosuccinate lyase